MGKDDLLVDLGGYFLPSWDAEAHAHLKNLLDAYFNRVSLLSSDSPSLKYFSNDVEHHVSAFDFPEDGCGVEQVLNELFEALPGSIDYAHPKAMIAASPPVTVVSLIGSFIAQHLNPNLAWGTWSGHFAELELDTIRMISGAVGYDPTLAGGLFTFGGSGTMLYGAKIGLEKCLKGTKNSGISMPIKMLARSGSHYSKYIVANWLGVGTQNIVAIPDSGREIDFTRFRDVLTSLIRAECRIATIFLELGSTYEFEMDDIKQTVLLRDQLVQEYSLDYYPHVHADAVIGWVFSVFHDYDFERNPLSLSPRALVVVQETVSYTRHLKLADSLGIDFHKLGFAPLTSSCIIVRDHTDLQRIRSVGKEEYRRPVGYRDYRPGDFSLECSRSAAGMLSAYLNCRLLGKNGFRCLLTHAVELTLLAVDILDSIENCVILNRKVFGPAIVFRLYTPNTYTPDAFLLEVGGSRQPEEIEATNERNREIYERLIDLSAIEANVGRLSFLDNFRVVESLGIGMSVFKFYVLSPFTTSEIIQNTFEALAELAREV